MRLAKWLLAGVGLIGIGFAGSLAAQGTQGSDVLSALLIEVRGLRQAMEQMASAGPRVQLALGRLQLQEQRLNTMIRRLESVRDTTASAQRSTAEMQRRVVQMQEALKSAQSRGDDPEVREFASQLEHVKRQLAFEQEEVQRRQAEEASLQQQIATEQARWTDINRALEELERAMQRR